MLSLRFIKLNKVNVPSEFILHKPYGYLSQFIYEMKRKKLLGLYDFRNDGNRASGRRFGRIIVADDGWDD
jgi:hypothetical protein